MWIKRLVLGSCLENSQVGRVSGVVCDSRPWEEGSEKQMESSGFGLTRRHEFYTLKGIWTQDSVMELCPWGQPAWARNLQQSEALEYLLEARDEQWGVARGQVVIVLLAWGNWMVGRSLQGLWKSWEYALQESRCLGICHTEGTNGQITTALYACFPPPYPPPES